jgi:ABC-type nitrate/sulfonate/bicarbonate transport system substrate-binding protein
MKHMRTVHWVAAAGLALLTVTPKASAEDVLKLASAQRGAWDAAAPELGQQAGIFKKHGIVLDLLYTQGSDETEQRATSGGVDVGLNVGVMAAMRAYSRGAPVRIIGANTTGATNYWYVLKTSPIQTVKDIVGKTIAYATNGSSSHYDALDLIKQFRVNARLVPTGAAAMTLKELVAGRIDVGWATPPFGVDEIEQNTIRVVARANDVPAIRGKTVNVMVTNAATLQQRKDVLVRFMQAYRETIEWMYSDPAALKRYADLAGVSEAVAQRQRDEFFTKDMLSPDQIVGVKAIMKDAITLRYIQAKLSRKQLAELIQIPPPVRSNVTSCRTLWGC